MHKCRDFKGKRQNIIFSANPIVEFCKLHFNSSVLSEVIMNTFEKDHQKKIMSVQELDSSRFQSLSLTSNIWIWEVNASGVYTYCSPTIFGILGYQPEEIIGKTPFDLVIPEERASLGEVFGKIVQNQEPIVRLVNSNQRKDGRVVILETNGVPFFDSGGEFLGYRGIDRDITKMRMAVIALQESQSRLINAIDMAKIGMWEFDSERQGFLLGDSFYSLFKTSLEEEGPFLSVEQYFNRFIHPDDLKQTSEAVQNAIKENRESFSLQHRIIRKDGEIRYVVARFLFFHDETGKMIRNYGLIQDITHIKRAEIELRELNASKDKFFSIIAHDLKNPFNTIIGFSEVLKEEVKKMDLESSEYYANLVNVSAVQTYRLLENLLEWANSQRGKTAFNRLNINLKDVLKEELDTLHEQASGKSIRVISYVPDGLMIFADKNMIKTVLRNLISNALKFTPRDGVVEINATSDATMNKISVTDSGIGMNKETMEKLFRIEGNLSTLGTENEKGTGLGLLLCKEFVEKHGGKIWVESEPDKGSTFRFVIPIEKNHANS
jgi:PAS domain S-box-containing protein